VLLCILPRSLIVSLLSGAVNWNSSSILASKTIAVDSTVPTVNFSLWYWYDVQGNFDKRALLRRAAGYASLAWANSAAVAANGTSLTGNRCRHVVNQNNTIPENSTLANGYHSCIKIHSISWTNVPPNLQLFSDTKNLGLFVAQPYGSLAPFGGLEKLESYLFSFWGNVSFTTGVTTSAVSTYISSRVIED
jgi:hypothetical protein